MANNPTLDRLQRTTVRENLPTLIEVIEGTLQLNEHGESRQVFKFINQIFTKPPLVVGFGKHPNGNVVKFPMEDFYDTPGGEFYPIYNGIGVITTNSVQLNLNTTKHLISAPDPDPSTWVWTYVYPNKLFKYKLRVYNVT